MQVSQDDIIITNEKLDLDKLKSLCERWFGDMVKIVVDIEKKRVGVGGELHADAEKLLIENGSNWRDVWGANLYPWYKPDDRIEYTALINIRPKQDNPSLEILDNEIKLKVKSVVENLILACDEELV